MNKKRKIIIAALAITLVAVLIIAGTLAYLWDRQEKTNTFSIGTLKLEVEEPSWNDGEDGQQMVPGDVKCKDPTIVLTGDAYVRFIVSIIDQNGDDVTNPNFGKVITDPARLALILTTIRFDAKYESEDFIPDVSKMDLSVDKEFTLAELALFPMMNPEFVLDAVRSETGVYYYMYEKAADNDIVKAGEYKTLFTNIVIPADWTEVEHELLGRYKINIAAEAIQKASFADKDEAFLMLDEEIAKKGS